MLRAHEYWRMKLLSADLVIVNERASSYAQELQISLEALVRGSRLRLSPDTSNVRGNIFLLRGDLITSQERAGCKRSRGPSTSAGAALWPSRSRDRNVRKRWFRPFPRQRARPGARTCRFLREPAIFQRPRRIRGRRPRICDCPWRRFAYSRTVDQRHCESLLWLSGLGIGLGVHVVAQQP